MIRDSLHTGVQYGRFDYSRLIDTLRVLPFAPSEAASGESSSEPHIGIEEGGLQAAEALALARYFMFSQVYLHPVRRIYDIHLKEFLKANLYLGQFPADLESYLGLNDAEIFVSLSRAARYSDVPRHEPAKRLVSRQHFKVLWQKNEADSAETPFALDVIFEAAKEEFGPEAVRRDKYSKGTNTEFPVLQSNGNVVSSSSLSPILARIPPVAVEYVFIRPELRDRAVTWLKDNLSQILGRTPSSFRKSGEDVDDART